MQLIKAEKSDLRTIKRLYLSAFPRCERKPFFIIRSKCRKGVMEVLKIYDGDFCGLAITASYGDMLLLNYFAVSPERRGGGIGSEALKLIMERYPGRRFFLEIETTKKPAPDSDTRSRRKAFYLRNGLCESGLSASLFGVEMEILTNGSPMTFDEYLNFYITLFGRGMKRHIKAV